jgi:hypothetical protein
MTVQGGSVVPCPTFPASLPATSVGVAGQVWTNSLHCRTSWNPRRCELGGDAMKRAPLDVSPLPGSPVMLGIGDFGPSSRGHTPGRIMGGRAASAVLGGEDYEPHQGSHSQREWVVP